MKRKKVWLLVVIIFTILIGGICMLMAKNQNVFDEMYYTWANRDLVKTSFRNVPAFSKNRIEGYTYPGGTMTNQLSLVYDGNFEKEQTSYLKENTFALVDICPDDKEISWICSVDCAALPGEKYVGDDEVTFIYDYDVSSKMLTIQPMQVASRSLAEKYPDRFTRYGSITNADDINEFLTLHGISNEDLVSYKEYFLNDVIIGLWITGNGDASRYKLTDIGDYTLVDNSNIS